MTSRDDQANSPPVRTRRFPAAVYLAGAVLVVTAFLLEIARGHCPVP